MKIIFSCCLVFRLFTPKICQSPHFLLWKKLQLLIFNTLIRARRGLLRSFLDFHFYYILVTNFSTTFFFENFPQFAPRGEVICDNRMLHFLDLFAAEIYFSMMFTYSLVYAGAFENRQISRS